MRSALALRSNGEDVKPNWWSFEVVFLHLFFGVC